MTRPAHARPHGPSGDSEAPRDDVLLDAAHAGDADAFAALRERYRGTALAVARSRTGSAEEAERVAEAALGRIEQIVGEGGGPRAFLGAFVVWMVGREADGGTRSVALPDDPADPTSLVRVFSGLPAEWQAFLWRTEVHGQSPRRAAAALGLGAVAAAGLHRDMVRGLRGLYGRAAADRAAGPECPEFSAELAHFVRGTRGGRSRRDVKEHLDGCARCTAEYLSRQDVGTGLRTWTLPVLAGLPLWGTEALELTNLIAGAGAGAGVGAGVGAGTAAAAAPGAVGAGRAAGAPAAGAAAGARRAGSDGGAGASAWSGRRAKVLLGAGALATAAVVATVGVTGGGDPVPAPGSLSAEQAPRTAEDLEAPRADDRADDRGVRAEQAEDDAADAGAGAREPEDGQAGADGTSADRGRAAAPTGTGENGAGGNGAGGNGAGGNGAGEPGAGENGAGEPGAVGNGAGEEGESGNGAGQEPVALAAGPGGGNARSAAGAAAAAGGSSAGTPRPAGADGPVTGAKRTASGADAGRGGDPGTPGAASAGGAVQTPPPGGSSTSTPPADRADVPVSAPVTPPAPAKTGAPAPVPSMMPFLPTPAASPAPLKAPVPGWTSAPPSDSGTVPGTRGRHAHQGGVAPGARRAEHRSERQGRSWQHQDGKGWQHQDGKSWRGKGSEVRKDAGRNGRGTDRGQHGKGHRPGAGGSGEGHAHR